MSAKSTPGWSFFSDWPQSEGVICCTWRISEQGPDVRSSLSLWFSRPGCDSSIPRPSSTQKMTSSVSRRGRPKNVLYLGRTSYYCRTHGHARPEFRIRYNWSLLVRIIYIFKDSHPLVFSPAHAVVCQKQFKEKPYWFEKDSFLTIHPRGTADTCPARPGTRCLPLLPPRYPANPGPLGTGSTSLSPLTQENRISSTHTWVGGCGR